MLSLPCVKLLFRYTLLAHRLIYVSSTSQNCRPVFTPSVTCYSLTSCWTILLSRDYQVLSEFTLALFEDSGWYKANYTVLYNLKQNPLQWGKGKDGHIT